MAMTMRRCNAEHIAQYSRSMAILDTIGHWTPPLGEYLHRIALAAAMVIDFGSKIKLWCCDVQFPKLATKRHKTDPLLCSLKRQAG
jgi:hypothetical protein